jgi:hypothetical protein
MPQTPRRFFLTALLALTSFVIQPWLRADETATSQTGKTVRLLTVGNSFSHNAMHYLGDLAKASGNTLVLQELIIGGSSFDVHWAKWEKALKDPADPAGQYTQKRNLQQWLEAGPWDVVTIQQASIKSHDLGTYEPYAKKLHDFIKQHAPGAEIMIHETWEYRKDDPRFSVKEPKPGEPKTQDEMYEGLKNAYAKVAAELKMRRIPVGDAFHLANHDPEWGYKVDPQPFDSKKAKQGELPDQTHSLNVGWQWKKGTDGVMKLGMDGHHASMAGEYLGACVWLETLFGKSPVGNTFVPKGLNPEYAKFLQETAHRAVTAKDSGAARSE